MDLRVIGARAKEAASYLNSLGITEKNEGLRQAAQALLDGEEDILTANPGGCDPGSGKRHEPGDD